MSLMDDVMNLENGFEDETEYYLTLQRVINAGQWSLQGSFGRSMMAAIESGKCMLGPNPASDYYGNIIPSRTMVKNGTKGSKLFVSRLNGRAYANKLAKVE